MTTTFYSSGKEGFPALLELIAQARSTLDIQMFIWRRDEIGVLLGQAVLDAAHRGVRVQLSKDVLGVVFEYSEESRGSFLHGRPGRRLSAMSTCLHLAYPMARKPFRRRLGPHPLAQELLNHPLVTSTVHRRQNNHSKYFLIDDEVLVLSGMNIEDKEWKRDLLGRQYHDFMVIFRDPAAVELFRRVLLSIPHPHRELSGPDSRLDFIVNVDHEGKTVYAARDGLLDRFDQVQREVVIVMAYIGDPLINAKLRELAAKGIRVTLYLPEKSNLQNDLNLKNAGRLLRHASENLQIWLCQDMIHAKLVLIDGDYVSVGSTNLNRQAMAKLCETNVGFYASSHGVQEQVLTAIEPIHARSRRVVGPQQLRFNPVMARLESLA